MMMSKQEFTTEVNLLQDQYDNDNQWFKFLAGGQSWSSGTWDEFVEAAWLLYEKACKNELQRILLGDTKIRTDSGLILNFGLAANSTVPQEAGDKQMVDNQMAKRQATAKKSAFKTPIEIMGPGSILSAFRWSPLLNDALMLGGIQNRQSFHLALNIDEQMEWNRIESGRRAEIEAEKRRAIFDRKRARFGTAVMGVTKTSDTLAKELWITFIHQVPRVLWEGVNPRVFARELIGLKTFGYKPQFDINGLGFFPTGAGPRPTFENYLIGVRAAGYTARDRFQMVRFISEFLFEDVDALNKVAA